MLQIQNRHQSLQLQRSNMDPVLALREVSISARLAGNLYGAQIRPISESGLGVLGTVLILVGWGPGWVKVIKVKNAAEERSASML